jgi:hypothetical protein
VDGEHRVEEVREADAVGLGDEPEERPVPVEAPRPAGLDDFETRLVMPIEDFIGHTAVGTAIDEGQSIRTVPLDAHHSDQSVGQDATNTRLGLEIFEFHTTPRPVVTPDAASKSGLVLLLLLTPFNMTLFSFSSSLLR